MKTICTLTLVALALLAFGAADKFGFAETPGDRAAAPTAPAAAAPAGMVRVPGGTFAMGCSPGDKECGDGERPPHQARVGAFWMDATHVTNAAYRKCVAAGGCTAIDEHACYQRRGSDWKQGGSLSSSFKGDDQPVVCATWNDATAYCRWSGKRLPTEAEWEFAARGGIARARYGDLDAVAWHQGNAGGGTHPVGRKAPNAYGLYDMLGNAWEWCADWWDDATYYSAKLADNPKGPESGYLRVLRGGSWCDYSWNVRASYRAGATPFYHDYGGGFRCARD
jgi:formylglycine-generating enzyme required for sulfatase activity